MENMKVLKWGKINSLLLAILCILCLEVVVGRKHGISNNVEKQKPLVAPNIKIPAAIGAPAKDIPPPSLKIQESPSKSPAKESTPTREKHLHTSNQPASKVNQSDPANQNGTLPTTPPSANNLLQPKKLKQKVFQTKTLHPYSLHPYANPVNNTGQQKPTHLAHTWKSKKTSKSDNQSISLTEIGDNEARQSSTPSPVSSTPELKSISLSKLYASKTSKLLSSSPVLNDNQSVHSTESQHKPGHPRYHVSTPSPGLRKSKLKSTSSSKSQTLQVSKVSAPELIVNQLVNSVGDEEALYPSSPSLVSGNAKLKSGHSSRQQTSKPGKVTRPGIKYKHPSTPSPVFHNSKLKTSRKPLSRAQHGRKMAQSTVTGNQVYSAELGDIASPTSSTPSPAYNVPELKSISLSQSHPSQVSEVANPSPVLNDDQLVKSTDLGGDPTQYPTTRSPDSNVSSPHQVSEAPSPLNDSPLLNSSKSVNRKAHHQYNASPSSHISKLRTGSSSRQQTSQVNKVPDPVLKVAKFFNKTEKPGHRPYHPSPSSQNSKLKQESPPTPNALEVQKVTDPVLTNDSTVSRNQPNNSSPVSHNSKLKPTSSSQLNALEVHKVPDPSLTDDQSANSRMSRKQAGKRHPYSASPASHDAKLKSTSSPPRQQTLQVSKVSSPILTDNQLVNGTKSGDEPVHHPSTPAPDSQDSELKSASLPQPVASQVSNTSIPVSTENQPVNSTESQDKLSDHSSTPSPALGSLVSKLKSTTTSLPQISSQVDTKSSPSLEATQFLNSTEKANKTHHHHNSSHVSHNSRSKSTPTPQQQTLQVSDLTIPILTDTQSLNSTVSRNPPGHHPYNSSPTPHNSKLKTPSFQPNALEVRKMPDPLMTGDQSTNSRVSRKQSGHLAHNSSRASHDVKLKSFPSPQQQTSQVNKVTSPATNANQFTNSTLSRNQQGHHQPHSAPQMSKKSNLKSAPPPRTPTLPVIKVSSPVLTDNELLNSTTTLYKVGHRPSTPSPIVYNSKLKPVSPAQPHTSKVDSVSSSVLKDNQIVTLSEPGDNAPQHTVAPSPGYHNSKLKSAPPSLTNKANNHKPEVKDIRFVTSTESGDKAAHFKLTLS